MKLSENIRLRCLSAPQARKIENFSHFYSKIQCFQGKKQLTGTGTTFLTSTDMPSGALTIDIRYSPGFTQDFLTETDIGNRQSSSVFRGGYRGTCTPPPPGGENEKRK